MKISFKLSLILLLFIMKISIINMKQDWYRQNMFVVIVCELDLVRAKQKTLYIYLCITLYIGIYSTAILMHNIYSYIHINIYYV